MADLIFYNKVVSLDSRVHKDLHVKAVSGYAYAAKTNSVPVVAAEFADVSREYPITFVKTSEDAFLPVALLGLRENENVFVDSEGKWDARYIPAFVRRYPFVPAEVKQGEMIICIDETADCLNKSEGEPLFAGDQPSAFLNNVVKVVQDYQGKALATQSFCKRLQELGLLTESNAQARLPDGTAFNLTGLFVLDEKRLQQLDKDQVHSLFTSGELGLIYAQLISLGNLHSLVAKLAARLAS